MARTDVALFAMEQGFLHENTLRLIRIGLPFLHIPALIDRHVDARSYSLIKKTLYDLLTGEDPQANPPVAYVQNRQEAFQLLGLDMDFYDVANRLFTELVAEGKVHDTPQGVLAGAAEPNDPAFLQAKQAVSHTCHLRINPFTAQICDEKVQQLRFSTKENLLAAFKADICLATLPSYIYDPDALQRAINDENFYFEDCSEEFKTRRLREQDMPAGTYGVQLLVEEEPFLPEISWMPYYLTLERTEEGEKYRLYGCNTGTNIDLFPINDPKYKHLQDFLKQLLSGRFFMGLNFNLTESVKIPLTVKSRGVAPQPAKGVTMDDDGNYITPLTDLQLAAICMEREEETVSALKVISRGRAVIATLEAGRLVQFELTEAQREFCEKVLAQPDKRYALALPLLQACADQGDAEAIYHLANCTFMGRGREVDYEEAFRLYEKAANENHAWALFQQGLCYHAGNGVPKDTQAALACWEKIQPKDKPYSVAMYNISSIHWANKEYEKAFQICNAINSEKPSDPFAACLLGEAYYSGKGTEKDANKAVPYFNQAAGQGHLPSIAMLSLCHSLGKGVEKDIDKGQNLLKQFQIPEEEDRLFFLGAKPFVPYAHLCYSPDMLEQRRKILQDLIKKTSIAVALLQAAAKRKE